MITIMTKQEFESASKRKTIEESDLVFVASDDGNGLPNIWMAKNKFGNRKSIYSMLELHELVSNYLKLVL